MTMADFAKKMQLNPSTLSRMRTGARQPNARQLTRWADALRLDADTRRQFIDLALLEQTPEEIRDRLANTEAQAHQARDQREQLAVEYGRYRTDQGFHDGWWLTYSCSFLNDGHIQRSLIHLNGAQAAMQVRDAGRLHYSYHGQSESLGDKIFIRLSEDRGGAHLFRIEGVEHLHGAIAKGKGVLLYLGHFTTLEICAPMVKPLVPLYAFMFRGRRNPLLNALQTRGRARYAHVSVANDSIREMLALLAKNAVVFYAPDQARIDSGELVPFFSHPAMTSTAPSRLARLSGATIVPMFFRRFPDDSGYLLRFQAPPPGIPSSDALDDTAKLTGVLESFIRECPEQYFWTHRKFKDRPGVADAYRESAGSASERD
jgi:lauroyl/myristoyl acyltransferase/transcriptional regulator with XRE-family HTH domain